MDTNITDAKKHGDGLYSLTSLKKQAQTHANAVGSKMEAAESADEAEERTNSGGLRTPIKSWGFTL